MEMKKTTLWPGEDQAWKLLTELDPDGVEKNTGVTFDRGLSAYALNCFGQVIHVSLQNQIISSTSPVGKLLVGELAEYSRLSILSYLIHAKDIPLSGNLKRLAELPGGKIFLQGTHVLPINKIAKRFNKKPEEFLSRGRDLGGSQLTYGDVSLALYPFPRVQIVLIHWSGDEEFPSNASLLLDENCVSYMSADVIWAMARMTIELMML